TNISGGISMKQDERGPDTDTSEAKAPVKGAIDASDEGLRQARAEIAREREPRWRVLVRGRFLLVAYIIMLIATGLLAWAAYSTAILPGDLPFTRELQESNSPIVFGILYFVSALGFAIPSALIEILALLILWLLRLRLEAVFLALSLLADLLGAALKIVVGRQRPAPDLVHVTQQIAQPSFPSGHTLHYTVFYGFLIFIIATNFKASWPRTAALVIFALLIALVGLSRVYLGEHWPTDVIGGYLIGGLCLVPLIAGYLWAKAHLVVTDSPPWIRRTPPASADNTGEGE
ncbi:MAG TPA: phosphatase PAP2 family protein, partial [Ktedonobacterales bacterium]|nr:phosphatase PAP2 family protein [Ktedonobacterales bacterium]